jgi:phenylpropionate dioxygenase-like ring-hydroxylating dioxygenase large terminal subunit
MLSHVNAPSLPVIDADEVDQRLAEGYTLPASIYTHPGIPELEDELVFRPAWHVVGTLADFRNVGDYLTAHVGGKYPVIVTKGDDGELHAFLNVCRHRGCLVAGGERGDNPEGVSGNSRRFRCPYHAWTYDLEGALIAVPDYKGAKLPPFEQLGLHPVSVDVWGGMVFVSIQPAEPLGEVLSDLPHVAEQANYTYPFLDEALEFAGGYSFECGANWKLYLENNLECYHCGVTHSQTLGAVCQVDVEHFTNVNFKNGNYICSQFSDDLEKYIGEDDAARVRETVAKTNETPMQQYWLWPSSLFTTGVLFGKAVFRIDPIASDRCRMTGRAYSRPDEKDETLTRLQQWMEGVVDEDTGVSQGVQIGLQSGLREWGPLLYKREESINWCSQQVWQRLAPAFRENGNGIPVA